MRHSILECMMDHFRRTFLILKMISYQMQEVLLVELKKGEKKRGRGEGEDEEGGERGRGQ